MIKGRDEKWGRKEKNLLNLSTQNPQLSMNCPHPYLNVQQPEAYYLGQKKKKKEIYIRQFIK